MKIDNPNRKWGTDINRDFLKDKFKQEALKEKFNTKIIKKCKSKNC